MRIVLMRAGGLGDVILTFPALRALRAHYPSARIEVVGHSSIWRLAGSLVDFIASIDSPAYAALYAGTLTLELQARLRDVDLAVAWSTRDPASLLRAAGVREVIAASPYPPPGVHAARWLLQSISDRSGFVSQLDSRPLELDADERESGCAVLRQLGLVRPVMLHPRAGADWKRWPAARFAAVGNDLARRGFQVLLIEGPADEEAVAEMQERAVHPFPVLRDSPLRELASILTHGAAFAGNDSGITHLVAALGIPTLALFGPTDPTSWSPLGQVRVLRTCQTRTQWQGQIRVCEDAMCMEGIAVDLVTNELLSLLRSARRATEATA